MIIKRNRTPSSEYIVYSFYLYFLGLSLKTVVKALSYLDIIKKSQVKSQFGIGLKSINQRRYQSKGKGFLNL